MGNVEGQELDTEGLTPQQRQQLQQHQLQQQRMQQQSLPHQAPQQTMQQQPLTPQQVQQMQQRTLIQQHSNQQMQQRTLSQQQQMQQQVLSQQQIQQQVQQQQPHNLSEQQVQQTLLQTRNNQQVDTPTSNASRGENESSKAIQKTVQNIDAEKTQGNIEAEKQQSGSQGRIQMQQHSDQPLMQTKSSQNGQLSKERKMQHERTDTSPSSQHPKHPVQSVHPKEQPHEEKSKEDQFMHSMRQDQSAAHQPVARHFRIAKNEPENDNNRSNPHHHYHQQQPNTQKTLAESGGTPRQHHRTENGRNGSQQAIEKNGLSSAMQNQKGNNVQHRTSKMDDSPQFHKGRHMSSPRHIHQENQQGRPVSPQQQRTQHHGQPHHHRPRSPHQQNKPHHQKQGLAEHMSRHDQRAHRENPEHGRSPQHPGSLQNIPSHPLPSTVHVHSTSRSHQDHQQPQHRQDNKSPSQQNSPQDHRMSRSPQKPHQYSEMEKPNIQVQPQAQQPHAQKQEKPPQQSISAHQHKQPNTNESPTSLLGRPTPNFIPPIAASPNKSLPSPIGEPFLPGADLEADLGQLTEEERAHIMAVLDRARQLQERDEHRVREMEKEFNRHTQEAEPAAPESQSEKPSTCPICHQIKFQVDEKTEDPMLQQGKQCSDCEKTVCPACGSNVSTEEPEKSKWLCSICIQRRRFLATSGLWHKYHVQNQQKAKRTRRSSLDEAFMAIQSPPEKRGRLERTSSYSQVEDIKKTFEEAERESLSSDRRSSDISIDSDELREEFLVLSRARSRSRERSPEYERRTSAGQEEVLRDLRRHERGFLVSDNTIEMDPLDAIHVEDLSEGLDEEEMMRQLLEMADGVEGDVSPFPDSGSSVSDSDIYSLPRDPVQERLEFSQEIARMTESLGPLPDDSQDVEDLRPKQRDVQVDTSSLERRNLKTQKEKIEAEKERLRVVSTASLSPHSSPERGKQHTRKKGVSFGHHDETELPSHKLSSEDYALERDIQTKTRRYVEEIQAMAQRKLILDSVMAQQRAREANKLEEQQQQQQEEDTTVSSIQGYLQKQDNMLTSKRDNKESKLSPEKEKFATKTRKDTPAVHALEQHQPRGSTQPAVFKELQSRTSRSLEGSPDHFQSRTASSSFHRSNSEERETEMKNRKLASLKISGDFTSLSDSELEKAENSGGRKKRRKVTEENYSDYTIEITSDETDESDKYVSVEDLRGVGLTEKSKEKNKDYLSLPGETGVSNTSSLEQRGNRPPAASRGSNSNRRKRGKKFVESPLSPIRDDEVEDKSEETDTTEEELSDISENVSNFFFPHKDLGWNEPMSDTYETNLEMSDPYEEANTESTSPFLTSPGGLETVPEEQDEVVEDNEWKRDNNSHKISEHTSSSKKNSSREEERVIQLREVPKLSRKKSEEKHETQRNQQSSGEETDTLVSERRVDRLYTCKSPELKQEEFPKPESPGTPRSRVSRVVDVHSPASSPVSSKFRFSPPVTPKLCSTGKTFPEASFPRYLDPTQENVVRGESIDENKNEIPERKEVSTTSEPHSGAGRRTPPLKSKKVSSGTDPMRFKHKSVASTQTESIRIAREIATQTSYEEYKRKAAFKGNMKSFGVQTGGSLDKPSPVTKVMVDASVETESESPASSPVSMTSSCRSVGIETEPREPSYSSGIPSPVSEFSLEQERFLVETSAQTSDRFDPIESALGYGNTPNIYQSYNQCLISRGTSTMSPLTLSSEPRIVPLSESNLRQVMEGMSASRRSPSKRDMVTSHVQTMNQYVPTRSFNNQTSVSTSTELSPAKRWDRQFNASPISLIDSKRADKKTVDVGLDARFAYSDTESVDSDMGTPRIKRRLPHVPSGSSPKQSPISSNISKIDKAELQKEIEFEKVRDLLSRKAIQLEMERRKKELDEMTTKIFGQSANNSEKHITHSDSSSKVKHLKAQKFNDGSLSDSDVITKRSRQNRQQQSSFQGTQTTKSSEAIPDRSKDCKTNETEKDFDTDTPYQWNKEKYVRLSKSEEDIIREIERQVSAATGKQYTAYDSAERGTQRGNEEQGVGANEHYAMIRTTPSRITEATGSSKHVHSSTKQTKKTSSKQENSLGVPTHRRLPETRKAFQSDESGDQKIWDIDTSPVHSMTSLDDFHSQKYRLSEAKGHIATNPLYESFGIESQRYGKDGKRPENGVNNKGKLLLQSDRTDAFLRSNANDVDRLSREGEEIERRIRELTELEAKLETDYQQYRDRVLRGKNSDGTLEEPDSLADFIMKSQDPSFGVRRSYDYMPEVWTQREDHLARSHDQDRLPERLSERIHERLHDPRVLPSRPDEPRDRYDESSEGGLILPLVEASDFDADYSSGSPVPQRRVEKIIDPLPIVPPVPPRKESTPSAVSLNLNESRQKQSRQLPVPNKELQQLTRSDGHRAQPRSTSQHPVVSRRGHGRGDRMSNVFHLKRNTQGPSHGSGGGGDLGLRVVGGKRMPGSNQLVAYIADVEEGGAAQKAGLREGDQVLEWCGTPLTGKTFEEVQLIMRTARKMTDVTVKCGPNLLDSPRYRATRPPGRETSRSHHGNANGSRSSSGHRREQAGSHPQYERGEEPPPVPSSREVIRPIDQKTARITGELQIRLAYDAGRGELRVDILRGRGLIGKDNDGLADPFVVIKLLPMKSSSDEKKTACVPRTLTPEWNQTLLFRDLRPRELLTNHSLELTVWSSAKAQENFMGKIAFNLSDTKYLDNRVHWYRLTNGESNQGKSQHKNIAFL